MDESKVYIIYTIIFIWLVGLTTFVILIKSNLTLLDVFKKIVKILFGKGSDREEVEDVMKTAGYDYDEGQDIFYSREDSWQKSYGYCRLYDEAASAFSMVMDSEPIYFEYDNKKWLIEFWKGQYGMCTGGEVGVYQTEKDEGGFTRLLDSTLYEANEDMNVDIKFDLRKNGEKLFTRQGSYWWITGFMLGEYSEPQELSMDIEITLESKAMLQAFLNGLRSAGYFDEEFEVHGKTVKLEFNEPRTVQPGSRMARMDNLQQINNKKNCDRYKLLIDPDLNSFDNLVRLKEIESDLFNSIKDFANSNELEYVYKNAKSYIK